MLLSIPQCTGQLTPQKFYRPKMSVVPRLRNSELGIGEAPVGKNPMSAACEHMRSFAGQAVRYVCGVFIF